ncbi:DUF6221 family protein [Actinoplanes sp. NPDC049681]|uniref:DUF6221 family protein n=1 Tax=Actinoplanes sp. NPDC049681 TaxID=3363905 RepID=UPI0037BCF788
MVDDLVQWLRQQLDNDERSAEIVDGLELGLPDAPEGHGPMFMSPEQYVNALGLLSGERIRADVAGKRRILDRHAECGTGHGYCDSRHRNTPACPDLLDVAATFAYRRSFRPEWLR